MNRRAFLAAIAGATLDPERLLWRPGQKLISIPAPKLPRWTMALSRAYGKTMGLVACVSPGSVVSFANDSTKLWIVTTVGVRSIDIRPKTRLDSASNTRHILMYGESAKKFFRRVTGA